MTDSNDPLTNIQQALEAAEGKLKRIVEAFDHLDCGVFLYGADDRLVFCNARAREIYQGISDLLVPGMEYETLLREFYRRDLYLDGSWFLTARLPTAARSGFALISPHAKRQSSPSRRANSGYEACLTCRRTGIGSRMPTTNSRAFRAG